MNLFVSWAILTAAVWAAAALVPGFKVAGLRGAIGAAGIFGLLNLAIGWLLFSIIGFVTLGLGFLLAFLTRWLVDAIVLKLTDKLTGLLTIRGFVPALLAALVMSLVGTFGEWLVGRL